MLYDSVISCKLDARDSQENPRTIIDRQKGRNFYFGNLGLLRMVLDVVSLFFCAAEGEHTILIVAEGGW
jgi:hypothetical protein